jgi:hypothetical protein
MRRWYWLIIILFATGLILFCLGLYYIYSAGEPEFGFELAIIGAIMWGILLTIGMFYAARVRIKILKDASQF